MAAEFGGLLVFTQPWLAAAIALLGGYLLGSIPFGVILTRMAGAGDLRAIGSGNIGATNVLRTGRKGLAAATLLLDGAKGAVAVLLVRHLFTDVVGTDLSALAAVGAFFGHCYPVWLRFRGGKGVATLLGLALALSWPCGLIFAAVWLGAALVTRYSSVGGMAAAISTPVSAAFFGAMGLVPLFLAFALVVVWKHRTNLARLLAGTEPRIGRKPSLG